MALLWRPKVVVLCRRSEMLCRFVRVVKRKMDEVKYLSCPVWSVVSGARGSNHQFGSLCAIRSNLQSYI